MTKKWKIFGYQTNIEWYDVKTGFKLLLRKITYSWLFQQTICSVLALYMKLVYYSSERSFVNIDTPLKELADKKAVIFVFWHNRLMMTPFITQKIKRTYPQYNFMTLASKHGDGQFVGKIMEKFDLISISGSTNDGRKASRGISFTSLKQILDGLKKGYSLGITPDGPRGPNQKINGEIVNIARISGAEIMAISCSSSRFIELKTWDKFKVPLPFSKLCFYFDDRAFLVPKNADEKEVEKIKTLVEERLNLTQEKSANF